MARVELEQSAGDVDVHQLDYAADSFWVSQDEELDWLDRNAVIDRKDSGKASQPPSTGSNRFSGSLKSKPSIIGLPKPTKPNYRRPCKASSTSIRLFPKRSDSVGNKSEPSSPKVSCMGRVRSRRGKSRRKVGVSENKSIHPDTKPGFWNNFRAIFRPKSQNMDWDSAAVATSNNKTTKTMKKKKSKKKREFESNACTGDGAEAPGLGAVKRFASARRSDAWAADLEVNISTDSDPHHVHVDLHPDSHSVSPAPV